jgi:lipoprotein-anchoring transpeptidase ErfK/SrfK
VRRRFGGVLLGLAVVLVLGACQGGGDRGAKGVSSSGAGAANPAAASPQVKVKFTPERGATHVRLDEQVVVAAEKGRLSSVTVRSSAGKELTGELDGPDGRWRSSGPLAPDTSYAVTAVATTSKGESRTETSTFTTLKPESTMGVVLVPGDDWTVGVGMPIIVQFSRAVKNREAAVKALSVTTTPEVEGAWRWMSDEAVWWRPRTYWPSGTEVKVAAALESVELATNVWGRRTYTTQFTIGSKIISTVDVNKHTLTVTKDGAVVRVLPVTTGMATPKYRTRNGIKVIMDKKAVETMDASSTGTQEDDPEYYNLQVKWAMRLTWSGEYLHAAPWSVGSQGRANVSHGCTGMSTANAKWLFDFSKIGDVVIYKNSPRQLEPGNGYTAWELSWERWSSEVPGKVRPSATASSAPSSVPSAASSSEPGATEGANT